MINDLAMIMYQRIFWNTPYDTGNLAFNGISDVGMIDNGVGFRLFEQPRGARGKGTEYGKILNEARTIRGESVNTKTGKVSRWSYVNKHYQWVDKFAEEWANEIPTIINARRVK